MLQLEKDFLIVLSRQFGVSDYVGSFIQLCGLGSSSPAGGAHFQLFRQLGILHLLVLSGSQVSHYVKNFFVLARFLGLGLGWSVGQVKFLHFLMSGLFLFKLGQLTLWDPPITRAILFFGFSQLCFEAKKTWILSLSLATHVVLFPEHLQKMGFYLSWFSFLLIFVVQTWVKSAIGQQFILIIVCQFFVSWITADLAYLIHWRLGVFLVSNLIFVWIFEKAFLPLLSWNLCLLFLLGPVWLDKLELAHTIYAPLTEVAAFILVGARYLSEHWILIN